MRGRPWFWVAVLVAALAGCGLLAYFGGKGGTHTVTRIGLGVTALTAAFAALAAALTWWGNRTGAEHQERILKQQVQMAEDIRRLAELTETSLEEARAQRPQPAVQWLIGSDRTPSDEGVLTRKRVDRLLEVEQIVQRERQVALSTLPPPENQQSEHTPRGPFASILATTRAFESQFNSPVTDADREAFVESVNRYDKRLREWLKSFEEWRRERSFIFEGRVRFQNEGRVPASGVLAQFHFPDNFEPVDELPALPDPPARPKFKRHSIADALMRGVSPRFDIPSVINRMPSIPVRGNVSAPRYRKGSTIVEYRIDKLLHGVPEDSSEPFTLRIDDDGDYAIPWEIHAENLQERAAGELRLQVITNTEEGPAITSVEELLPRRAEAESQ
jgi:hypothetical protein